jgi:lipopolysaccharide transport system ATP-binding protein
MSSDIAISVRGVSKVYLIYERPQDRLRQAIVPRLKRLMGRQADAEATRYFREFRALDDVSFDVPRGSTLGIIGRNGSGKSTVLQIICGTVAQTSGEVIVNGRIAALLELGSGFNPEFTGRENVFLNASILGLTREQTQDRFERIERFADIGDFIDQPVKTYSSGMVVRLAFAVIAHVDADILVIDEALSVGDAFFTQKCMRFLREFMRNGTVLFVSHDTGALTSLCETAIWLDRGRKVLEASSRTVSERYLEALVEDRQGPAAVVAATEVTAAKAEPATATGGSPAAAGDSPGKPEERPTATIEDPRLALLRDSGHRNDIQLFEFDPGTPGFGKGAGRITDVRFETPAGKRLAHIVGGELVVLSVLAEAVGRIERPILGFLVRDRLGQQLFGDNTHLSTPADIRPMSAGERFEGRFEFQMPILPMGDYSITVALADGTQSDHVHQQWIHDAVVFRSLSSSVSHGLVGIPMRSVVLGRVGEAPASDPPPIPGDSGKNANPTTSTATPGAGGGTDTC